MRALIIVLVITSLYDYVILLITVLLDMYQSYLFDFQIFLFPRLLGLSQNAAQYDVKNRHYPEHSGSRMLIIFSLLSLAAILVVTFSSFVA